MESTTATTGPGTPILAPAAPPDSAKPGKPKRRQPRPTLLPEVRDHQIEMLEAVFQRTFEEAQPQWERVLKDMGLEICYYIPARLVIDTVPWREKACPYGYVATVTRRKAKRLGLADGQQGELQLMPVGERGIQDSIDYLGLPLSKGKNGVWKAREPEDDPFGPTPVGYVKKEWLRADGDPGYDVDWSAVAQAADLDDIEAEILECRSLGFSRTALLAGCQSEAERLEYQAGWKRLSRKMDRVEQVLAAKKTRPKTSPISEPRGSRS